MAVESKAMIGLFAGAAPLAPHALDLSGVKEVYGEILAAQEEVGGTVTYRAKVAAGGGRLFEIVTGDEAADTSAQTIKGIVIHEQKCSAYFEGEGSSPPLCSSMDWTYGTERESGEVHRCADCPRHQFGSAEKGGGRACKDMIRLYILTEGIPLPLLLSLPPTSLKNWQNYRLATLAPRRLRASDVVTEFSLSPAVNAAGIKYSVVKPRALGLVDEEARPVVQMFAAGIKSAVSGDEVSGEDYNRGEAKGNTDAQ
jgi:hypothetical protein